MEMSEIWLSRKINLFFFKFILIVAALYPPTTTMSPKPKAAKAPGKKFKPKAVVKKEVKTENGDVGDLVKSENKSLMNNDAFKELISTSQKEANWTRQKQKKKQKLKYKVAFGELEFGGTAESERSELTFIENEGDYKQEDYKLSAEHLAKQAKKAQKRKPSLLDYQQQYPTMLPLKEPAEESQVHDIDDGLASFLPPEHATQKDKSALGGEVIATHAEEEDDELLLFQFPPCLPLSFESAEETQNPTPLAVHHLPPQKVGKLLTYESGALKLQIGELLFDVTKGCDMRSSYGATIVNAPSKNFVHTGEVGSRLVCSPNVNDILGLASDLNSINMEQNQQSKEKQQKQDPEHVVGDVHLVVENGNG
eukprot:TRINITY_DN19442_c0_g1_i4.p1 TRINITY_DN19442_c0_g1~~TRINITY_DN19442_c0_g1_i4.p1  ORF type:complete len:366 (+),score=78.96 TRINITY_DN19442_c0_g1_i4:164-1261(+)